MSMTSYGEDGADLGRLGRRRGEIDETEIERRIVSTSWRSRANGVGGARSAHEMVF